MKTIAMSHFTKAAALIAAGHSLVDTRVARCSDRWSGSRLVSFVLSEKPVFDERLDIRQVNRRLHDEMTRLAPEAIEFYFEDENVAYGAELEDGDEIGFSV